MLERASAVFALLTVIPQGRRTTLADAAGALWAFPLAGLAVGAIAGTVGAGAMLAGLEPLLAAVCTVAALALLTGMHHLDGLADLADALMVRGSRERRVAALKDHATGTAGSVAVAISLMALVAAIYPAGPWGILAAVVSAEVIAKLSMVILMRARAAAPDSTAEAFVRAAADWRAVAATAAVAMAISIGVSGVAAIGAAAAAIIVALLVGVASERGLGGLRGDSLGAANELARIAAVIVLVGAQ